MAVMYLIVGLFALFQVCKRTRAKPTALFKWYARLLIVACVLRMLYFGLPTKLTGVPYSPTDLAMYGPRKAPIGKGTWDPEQMQCRQCPAHGIGEKSSWHASL